MWQQMPKAAQTVHEPKVVCDDLKLANFAFVAGILKLIDFGILMSMSPDKSTMSIEHSRQVGRSAACHSNPSKRSRRDRMSRRRSSWGAMLVFGRWPRSRHRAIPGGPGHLRCEGMSGASAPSTSSRRLRRDSSTRRGRCGERLRIRDTEN
jgi:hypothetical protein